MNAPSLFDEKPAREKIDVAKLGAFVGILITEEGGLITFAGGDVVMSSEQIFAILRHQRMVKG